MMTDDAATKVANNSRYDPQQVCTSTQKKQGGTLLFQVPPCVFRRQAADCDDNLLELVGHRNADHVDAVTRAVYSGTNGLFGTNNGG